ncbi:MAG TPA: 3-phosphoshikimate 1-carboxyvinyltransferase [Candidatus Deferrimicrobiaceae bacterium]|nr:3-phosphoshikimate 1-carboxyvinyltransferase [Candidatus Deferrimicrobiaceae bacterium]
MRKAAKIAGTVTVPGDKSISHRAVMLASMAEGESQIRGFLAAEDALRSVRMMQALGADVHEISPTEIRVNGRGMHAFQEPQDVIDAGNSGTTIRIGAGILAAQPFVSIVTGDPYLRRRPMGRVVRPLTQMGAEITGRRENTLPPLCIRGGNLRGIRYEMPVASAQVKSSILLAGLYADSPVTVVEPLPSRDHTERMLLAMGARVERGEGRITVHPAKRLNPLAMTVPGDISSASFFLVLAASVAGASLRVPGVGVNPGRTGLVSVLRRMGADVRFESVREEGGEPVADLVVLGRGLAAAEVPPEEIPSLIDEVPALCVAGAMAEGRTEIRGAAELRVKESDRIGAMVKELSTLGVPCGEYPDGLWVKGPARIGAGQRVHSHGDHRIAMALLVLSAASGIPVEVSDTGCIATSFPDFFGKLREVVR